MGRFSGELGKIDYLILKAAKDYEGRRKWHLDFQEIQHYIIKAYELGRRNKSRTRRNLSQPKRSTARIKIS